MFNCKDKGGRQIHIEDVAILATDHEEIIAGTECTVIGIFSEEEVQINPVNVGEPCLVSPETLEVRASFIEDILGLTTDEELQTIIKDMESREEVYRESKKRKVKKEGGKSKSVSSGVVLDL
ncbi:MAG: hypothetical protein GY861_25235 [bacterium]|nr:hypothetical protein [bacterium]